MLDGPPFKKWGAYEVRYLTIEAIKDNPNLRNMLQTALYGPKKLG